MKYRCFGYGTNTLVFLHGWGGNIDSFNGLINAFMGDSKIILVDFEHNVEPAMPLTLDDYVEEVRNLINKEKISEAFFICHSFGGRVGVRLARKYSHLVKGLVLIDSAGLKPRRGIKYHFKLFLHKFLKKCGKTGLKGSEDFRRLTPNMKATFINIVNEFTDRDLKYITMPVLLLWGSEDKDTPLYMARRYKRMLPNARLKVFKGASHFSYLERRSETISEIKAYISLDE